MNRFKIGDFVKIINSNPNSDIPYSFTEEMRELFGGRSAHITGVEKNNYSPINYAIEGDGCRYFLDLEGSESYWWSDAMFETLLINILEL